ncbi:MAG: MSCRAMM family protein [Terriglobales bacterium]
MIRASCGVLLLLLAGIAGAQVGDLQIEAGKRIEIFIPDAIMAFSRHSSQARVLAEDGSVFIAARHPGLTQIVVLTPTQVLRSNLVVTAKVTTPQANNRTPVPPKDKNRKPADRTLQQPNPVPPQSVVRIEGQTVRLQEVQVQPAVESGAAVAVLAGRSTQIKIAGATAALSVDSELVDASASHGVVDLSGRAPGRAEVLIITPAGVKSIYVLVSPAPPAYPPGFIPPVALAGNEVGSFEFRFVSDPRQIQNRLDYTLTKADRITQLHLVNVEFLNGITGNNNVDIPSGFYRIAAPGWNLTLLDQNVANSPLTVDGVTVRGIHLGIGPWTVHAGYSSLASFDNVLIPTQREVAFGLSHAFKLSPNSELIQNAYYFPTHSQTFSAGQPGSVASLEYRLRRPRGLELLAELGFSHGVGSAAEFQWSGPRDSLHGSFREKLKDFATLSIGNLPGSVAEFSWNRTITPALASYLNVSENHILLPTGQQTNANSTGSLQYKVSHHWSVSTGATYAMFSQSSTSTNYSVHSLSLPEQINFDQKHFGAGFQYQFAKTSGSFSPGQDLRGTARLGWNRLQLSGFVERQTQALTVSSLYSQIPSLQIELQRVGLTAIDPSQLAALLQDNAFLLALGLSQQATLNLLPVRLQTGAGLNWTSHGVRPQRLSLDFIHNSDQLLQGKESNWIQSGSYTLPLTTTDELAVSYSWFHYSALGQAQYSPQVTVGVKHSFSAFPSFLTHTAHGTITGVVYVDRKMRGRYDPQMPTLADVEVILDGLDRTRTNERGRYTFSHVPQGQHTLEASFKSTRPFWFTTPSVVNASINQSIDFGITFAASELVGHVKNDAGLGVPDVEIEIKGPNGTITAHSDADGRFAVSGLSPGDYELTIDPNTVPTGHSLDDLRVLRRRIEEGIPQSADFRIRALRTVFGDVTYYDSQSGQYSPISGAIVRIPELSLRATTDRQGKFILRELPSGSYTLTVSGHFLSQTRLLSISARPIERQEDFRIVGSKNQ